MRNDQELYYASGEMSDADLLAFEQSLSGSAAHEASSLKDAFASLRTLNEGIPEPQISFDRVRHAIESGPVAKPVMPWRRWALFATPVAAMALVAMFASRSSLNNVPEIVAPDTTAVASVTTPKVVVAPPIVANVDKTVIAKVTEPKISFAIPESRPVVTARRSSSRRHSAGTLVASNIELPSASRGLPKRVDFGGNEPASFDSVPVDPGVTGAADSMGTGGASSRSTTGANQPVVVVTSTPDSQTGANTAVEVSKQNDVVLGG